MKLLGNLTAYTLTTAYGLNIEFLRRELDCSVTRVNTSKLDVLRDSVSDNLTIFGNGIHLNLLGMLDELAHYNWMILAYVSSQLEESLQFVLVRANVHGSTREHIRRTYKYRESNTLDEAVDVLHACKCAPLWLVDAIVGKHLRELGTVLSVVNILSLGTEDWHVLLVEKHSKVVRNLTTSRNDYTVRCLKVDDVHHTLECQLVEVETVAHVVVG